MNELNGGSRINTLVNEKGGGKMDGLNGKGRARRDAQCVAAALRVGILALLVSIGIAFAGMRSAQADWITVSNTQNWGDFGDGGFGEGDTLQILAGGNLTVDNEDDGIINNRHLIVEEGGVFTANCRINLDYGGQITMNGGNATMHDEFKFPDSSGSTPTSVILNGGLFRTADAQSDADRGSVCWVGGGAWETGNINDGGRDPRDQGTGGGEWNIQLLPGYDTIHTDLFDGDWVRIWASGAPAGNDSTITTSASQDFGRVMLGQTPTSGNLALGKTGDDATTYTAAPSNDGLSVTADGAIDGGVQTENITASLVNNANGSGSTGAKSWTVTIENTAADSAAAGQGSNDPNDVISVSGTIVDERVVSQQLGGPTDLGKALVGVSMSGTAVLSTDGDDDNFTRVTVAGGSDADITVAVDAGIFDSMETQNRAASGSFATSGSKSSTVDLAVTGEGLTGEGAYSDVAVGYMAEVYQALVLSTSIAADDLMLANASSDDGGQRAAAQTVSDDLPVGSRWTVDFTAGTVVTGGNNVKVAEASFDASGLLNHPTLTYDATYTVTSEYDDGDIDLGGAESFFESTWDLSTLVTDSTGGDADVANGESYAGYGATSGIDGTTGAVLLGGTAGGEREITMSFLESDHWRIVGDMVALSGTATDTYVLQMSYDQAALEAMLGPPWIPEPKTEEEVAAEGALCLVYQMYVPYGSGSVMGEAVYWNDYSEGGAPTFVLGAYDPAYSEREDQGLGFYGVDTDANVVWAVLNHNSVFAVAVLPEPGGLGMIGLALLALRKRRS